MANDENPRPDPAPLPRHERTWRHPSEIGQQRRALARRSPAPLSRFVSFAAGLLGVALAVAVVALIVPPDPNRDTPVTVRNAARGTAPTTKPNQPRLPDYVSTDGTRFFLRARSGSNKTVFVTTVLSTDTPQVVSDEGRPLTVVGYDPELGLVALTSPDASLRGPAFASASASSPRRGTKVVLHGTTVGQATIGMSVTSNPDRFIPLESVANFGTGSSTPSGIVTDVEGQFLGLYIHRGDARGFVPLAAIKVFVSQFR